MTAAQREELRKAIAETIARTSDDIARLEAELAPIAPDCCLGELTRTELMGEQAIHAKTHEAACRKLNRLTYALSRIDDDAFGLCEACEEPIAAARLMIMPEATLCVACANEKGR